MYGSVNFIISPTYIILYSYRYSYMYRQTNFSNCMHGHKQNLYNRNNLFIVIAVSVYRSVLCCTSIMHKLYTWPNSAKPVFHMHTSNYLTSYVHEVLHGVLCISWWQVYTVGWMVEQTVNSINKVHENTCRYKTTWKQYMLCMH